MTKAEQMRQATAAIDQLTVALDSALTADAVRYLSTHKTYTPEMEAFLATLPGLRRSCESFMAVVARLEQITRRHGSNNV